MRHLLTFFPDFQVMALIAYLMEYKGNYGPHLIIVPNAVMVNWKVLFSLHKIVRSESTSYFLVRWLTLLYIFLVCKSC